MIHFVGAGPGAADLITLRGARLLEEADVVVYAGSLVNPELLDACKPGCATYDSSAMTLEQIVDVMESAFHAGLECVRLHTGDPALYGAHHEQMDALDARGIPYDVVPGVSSLFAPLDIDGQDRAAVPDIGADQFVPGAETLDTDGDGISDVDEDWVYWSDPFFADSDGDGSPDGAEIANGTDPLDRLSHFANVALTVTNTFPSASVTNYFGFSMSAAG